MVVEEEVEEEDEEEVEEQIHQPSASVMSNFENWIRRLENYLLTCQMGNFPKTQESPPNFSCQKDDMKSSTVTTHRTGVSCESYCYRVLSAWCMCTDTHFCV